MQSTAVSGHRLHLHAPYRRAQPWCARGGVFTSKVQPSSTRPYRIAPQRVGRRQSPTAVLQLERRRQGCRYSPRCQSVPLSYYSTRDCTSLCRPAVSSGSFVFMRCAAHPAGVLVPCPVNCYSVSCQIKAADLSNLPQHAPAWHEPL